eukprot:403336868
MYNHQYNLDLPQFYQRSFEDPQFGLDDQELDVFKNSIYDDHNAFIDANNARIAFHQSCFNSTERKQNSLERIFEDQSNLLSPKMHSLRADQYHNQPIIPSFQEVFSNETEEFRFQDVQAQTSNFNDDDVKDQFGVYQGSLLEKESREFQVDQTPQLNKREIKRARKSESKSNYNKDSMEENQYEFGKEIPTQIYQKEIMKEMQSRRLQSQRIKKPSQKFLESKLSYQQNTKHAKQIENGSIMIDSSLGCRSTDYDHLGSRSTSEKSSNLSTRRFVQQNSQYVYGFQQDHYSSPLTITSRGRTLKNPIHEDFVQYQSHSKIQVKAAQPKSKQIKALSISLKSKAPKTLSIKQQASKFLRLAKSPSINKIKSAKVLACKKTVKQGIQISHHREQPSKILSSSNSKLEMTKDLPQEKFRTGLIHQQVLKPKTNSQLFSINEVIVSSEISGRIDTSKWVNQANIVTPDFKKALSCVFVSKNLKSDKSKSHNKDYNQSSCISTEQSNFSSPLNTNDFGREQEKSYQRNLSEKFKDAQQVQKLFIIEHRDKIKPKNYFAIEYVGPKHQNDKEQCEESSDEELTDDEVFLQRHEKFEHKEVVKYNIGLNKKDQQIIQNLNSNQVPILSRTSLKEGLKSDRSQKQQQISNKKSQKRLLQKRISKETPDSPLPNDMGSSTKRQKTQICEEKDQAETLQSYNLRRNIGKSMDEDFVYDRQVNIKKRTLIRQTA